MLGVVTHYFPHVQAAVVQLKKPLAKGDLVLLKGNTTNFEQTIDSMQIDHVSIDKAKKGDEIGLQVKERVREHDLVLLPA
ncbi:MAG: translation elongation factor-like protein [Candidatus Omnitrophica bacterium]|nr:translation elongation factor-like protein [Candidatus Omnitrophota bacterium]